MTLSWARPDPLYDSTSIAVSYKIEVLKKDGTTWATLTATESSNAATPSKIYTMTDLKTASTYTSTDNGAYIKIRITATNSYGTSSASDSNLDSAVYQSVPVAYAGTYTTTVGLTTATISWTDVTNAADYGYAAISGWKYGYKTGAGSYTLGTTLPGVRTISLTGLTQNTLYTFFVEPLNVYQVDGDITTNRGVGTTFTTSTVPAAPTLVNVTRSTNKAVITWTESPDPSNPVQSYYVEFKNQAGTY